MFNEDQVMKWSGIGYDDHDGCLTAAAFRETAERFPIALQVFQRVIVNLVLFQKAIELIASLETKEPPNLSGCQRAGTIAFKRNAFQRRAGQILPLGH